MPVLINKDNLAENLSDQDAQNAIAAGTHDIPLIDPQGNHVIAPHTDAPGLLQQGFKQPSSEQLQSLLDQTKYGTTSEQLKTGLEGAASDTTFGVSSAIEGALLGNQKEQRKRAEVNPGSRAIGEGIGLLGSMATGVGEGELLGQLGKAVIPEAATAIGRVGTMAARGAIENMAFQAGSEADKLFMGQDPHAIAETAIADFGMSALIGGAGGGILGGGSELWKAGPGKKLEGFLGSNTKYLAGIPKEILDHAGISVPPEINAALSSNVKAQEAFQILQESNSSSADVARGMYQKVKDDMHGAAFEALGKSPEDIGAVQDISEYETGKEIQKNLVKTLDERYEPINAKYDDFNEKFKSALLTPEIKARMGNEIADLVSANNLNGAYSPEPMNLVRKVLTDLENQTSAGTLKQYITSLNDANKWGDPAFNTAKMVKKVLEGGQESAITAHIGDIAPELIPAYAQVKSEYSSFRGFLDDMNGHLKVGKNSPGRFIDSVRDMAPENLLRKLGPKGDVQLQQLLETNFPEVSKAVKEYELNKLIKSSLTNGELNIKKLFSATDRMGEDLRKYVLTPEQLQQIKGLRDLDNLIPTKMNPSGTARTIDKLRSYIPSSAAAFGALLFGHNPVAGWVIGQLGSTIGREAPDAMRMAMLKFLGSSSEISAEGFHATTKLASAVSKGEKAVADSVKHVFGAGGKVIPLPSSKAVQALEEQVKRVAEQDPEQSKDMMSIGGKTNHYMPETGAAIAMIGQRNLQYLASLKPVDKAISPLDADPKPNSEQLGNYQRALQIAEQPLVITRAIKNGSITAQDLQHLQTLYPALYQRMSQKMFDEMTNKPKLPYATKLGISSFLGQPLDSTLTPNSIMSTQQSFQLTNMPQPIKPSATGMKSMQKLPGLNQTPMQSRESGHNGRH